MAGTSDLSARDFDNSEIIRALHASADGVLITIPYNTQQTHSGRFFFSNFYNASLADNGTLDLLMVSGRENPHIAVMVDIGGDGTISIYEGVTASNNGTSISAVNANRTSSNSATATVFHTPTITNTGTTLMLNHYVPGGNAGHAIGGSSTDFARVSEFVLLSETKYLFRLTNVSGQAQKASVQLGWFEDL